jgi:Family of unknown function (DUF6535)
LFSATVAAFLVAVNQSLQQNPQDTIAFYSAHLYQIAAAQAGSSNGHILPLPSTLSDPSTFKPSSSSIWVNVLWFLSLIISLTCALIATLLQQWARRYLRVTGTRRSLDDRARVRAYFAKGVDNLHLRWVVEALPGLLHLSVFLFFAGLPIFLFGINHTVFIAVLSCVGTCGASYLCISVMPLVCNSSPYYTPLSSLIWSCRAGLRWFYLWIMQGVISHPPIIGLTKASTRRNLIARVQESYERLRGGLTRYMEDSALISFKEFDVQVLSWTFDLMGEEDGLDRVLAAIPGFYNSSSAKDQALKKVSEERLTNAVFQVMDRSHSSAQLSQSAKQQQSDACMKVLEIRGIPVQQTMKNSLRFIGTGVFKCTGLGLLASSVDGDEAEVKCVTALITTHTRGSDERWLSVMEKLLGKSKTTLLGYRGHGDSLLLANLINFVRWMDGRHFPGLQEKAIDDTLNSLSKFDAKSTLPGLRDEFCHLWNTTVAVQGRGTARERRALSTLRHIAPVYIALHRDVPRASGDNWNEDLLSASSYPRCRHRHINS